MSNIVNFISCNTSYEESKIVLFGAPYDCTTSFRPGSRFAPNAIRSESFGIETYSPYQDLDLEDINVYDDGDIEFPFGNASKCLSLIESKVKEIISDNKIPFMIGGEHLLTLGAIKGLINNYNDLYIVQFDAHADLRDDYLGEKLSHATVMRRCDEILEKKHIFQFGIRSGEKKEFLYAKEFTNLTKFNFSNIKEVISFLKTKKVYISLDLDILDPSIFPGTGTPEAGGVTFNELLEALLLFKDLDIVGIDVMELSPTYDQSGVSTAVACKIIRELLLILNK